MKKLKNNYNIESEINVHKNLSESNIKDAIAKILSTPYKLKIISYTSAEI